jgi:hypothetical protein
MNNQTAAVVVRGTNIIPFQYHSYPLVPCSLKVPMIRQISGSGQHKYTQTSNITTRAAQWPHQHLLNSSLPISPPLIPPFTRSPAIHMLASIFSSHRHALFFASCARADGWAPESGSHRPQSQHPKSQLPNYHPTHPIGLVWSPWTPWVFKNNKSLSLTISSLFTPIAFAFSKKIK